MQELIFKNYFKALFVFVMGIAVSSAVTLVNISNIDVPMPLLALGVLACFLGSCFIIYPKASMGQTLQITILGILFNSLILTGTYYSNIYLNLPEFVIKPEFLLHLNPFIILTGFLFSVLTLCVGVKIEEIKESQIIEEELVENEPEKAIEQNIGQPKETAVIEPETKEEKINQHEIHKIETSQEQENEEHEKLEPLEPVELEDKPEPEKFQEPEFFAPPETKPDYIPTNIRLVQTSHTKEEDEKKGRIGSIGKLLVNNKDIEHIIESEEFVNSKTNVITTVSGEKIYEKFDMLKHEFSCIKEMALIDKGGFILANNFEDKQRVQIAGALISGAYHTLQNYLSQVSLAMPIRIFFETEDTNCFILKTKEEILFSIWGKEFQQVDYGPMTEMFETENLSKLDIIPYADLIKVEKFAVSDSEGILVNSFENAEDSQLFAAVSSAIFENLKVFLMNIRLFNLSKIAIFTPQKTITIIKPEDKIASFLTDAGEYPKVSEELLNMEEI